MKIRIKVQGLRECRDAMASLSTATQKNIMRRVLVARGEPIRAMAAQLAPVDTGFLRKTVRIQSKTGGAAGRAAFASTMASGGTRAEAGRAARSANAATAQATEIYIGPNAGPREIAAEFGTKDRAPTPFMRPAFDANRSEVLENIRGDLWEEIQKALKRRAKKAAKLAALAKVE